MHPHGDWVQLGKYFVGIILSMNNKSALLLLYVGRKYLNLRESLKKKQNTFKELNVYFYLFTCESKTACRKETYAAPLSFL